MKGIKIMKMMKIMKLIIVYCLLIAVVACGDKNKQTLAPEEVKETVAANAPTQSAVVLDTIIPAPGIKYQEARKIDPAHPLVTIDLTAEYEAKEVDLATMYSSVEYIILKHPLAEQGFEFLSDTNYHITYEQGASSGSTRSWVYPAGDKLVAGDNFLGYFCFDREGNYLHTVYSPETLPTYNKESNTISIVFDDSSDRIISFSINGDNCLLQTYKESKYRLLFHSLASGKVYLSRPYYSSGYPYFIDDKSYFDYQYNPSDEERKPFMQSFTLEGDTLCSFMNNNELVSGLKRGAYANPEGLIIYRYNDVLTIRQPYNDTIFRMPSAHELIPAYRLDMKDKKPDMATVLRGDNLDKFYISYFNETDDFLALSYTKNRDSKNNRKDGSVTLYTLYYDKKDGKTYKLDYANGNANTLADAIPYSILSMGMGDNNELYTVFSKQRLINMTNNPNYLDKLSESQQRNLTAWAEELQEGEMLVMILK